MKLERPEKRPAGLWRFRSALRVSIAGLRAAFIHEEAFRQELALAAVLIPAALFTPAAATGKALMILSVMLVLVVELLNSAIEALTDRVSLEYHALAKRAKDLGSAAVMVALIAVPVTWGTVLFG